MKILILLATLLAFSGCGSFHEKPLPASEATHINLTVKWVDHEADIPGYIKDSIRNTGGAAIYFDVEPVNAEFPRRHCTIYMLKPYGDSDFKALGIAGHELLHCTDGEYHGRYRDMNGAELMGEMGI